MNFPIELPPQTLALAVELKILPEDIDEFFTRGGGPGGQKINKTASLVQLIHHPTGIEIRMQQHREQSKNRLSAWKLLVLKLEERVKGAESELQRRIFKVRKQKARRGRKSKERVLRDKRTVGMLKQLRKSPFAE